MKNNILLTLISAFILVSCTGCVNARSAEGFASPSIMSVDGEEISQFILPYITAYNYKTNESYNIQANLDTVNGNFVNEPIVFQGQELKLPREIFSYYSLKKSLDGYYAELDSARLSLSAYDGGVKFKGIAFYKEYEDGYKCWILRPLFEEDDDILPLVGKFTDDEIDEIEDMSSIIIGGKEYKTHPFDIMYLALDEEYTKETIPDFKADKSRAYLVEGEAENIEFGIGYSAFYHAAPNTVLCAEEIGESPLNE